MTSIRRAAVLERIRLAPLLIAVAVSSGCGGGSGDGGGNPAPATVTVGGRITFDRIPFSSTGNGLNPGATLESPARLVTVEALDATSSAVLATATTDTNGNYSLSVPSNRNMKIRAKAQMVKSDAAPTWNFSVLNNTNGNALYVLDGSSFDSGTTGSTRNLRATSGWGTTSYTGTRAAAPFAILDTVYTARALILSAAASTAFPTLNLYWSSGNRSDSGTFCTNTGDIGTTFFTPGGQNAGNCTQDGALNAGIYILGDFANGGGDTDEFDQHVIAHEFGHYIENNFSRSDSIGGQHSPTDRLDLRVAFGEGWGNAYSAMALNDPLYRDSGNGIGGEMNRFNVETDNQAVEGWFGEFSVQEILWDLFDSVADGGDQISLGFAPLYSVMTGAEKTTDALTSIFSFADALRAANPAQAAAINALLAGEAISVSDAFASNETNDGGTSNPDVVPIYTEVVVNAGPIQVCSNAADGTYNKIGNRRLLRLNLTVPTNVSIAVTGLAGAQASPPPDPDMILWTRGDSIVSEAFGTQETLMRPLGAGVHVVELYECTHVNGGAVCHADNPAVRLRTCMSVAITGS